MRKPWIRTLLYFILANYVIISCVISFCRARCQVALPMLPTDAPKNTILKPVEESHVFEAFRLIDQNRAFLTRWLPWVAEHKTIEDTLFMIQRAIGSYTRREGVLAGIWYEGALVGFVGHCRIDTHNRTAELTIWLGEPHQGMGLATRALRSMVRYSFDTLHLERLEMRCPVDNVRAMALATRLGFMREGTLRWAVRLNGHPVDVALYGLVREDWD